MDVQQLIDGATTFSAVRKDHRPERTGAYALSSVPSTGFHGGMATTAGTGGTDQLRVGRWMTRNPVTATPRTSILNARRLLATYGIRHLPVVDGDRLVGMLSERDLRIGDMALSKALAMLGSELASGRYRSIDTLMSAPVVVTSATETVEQAANRMLHYAVGALPVVDQGRLVGILSMVDCMRALLEDRTAAKVATPDRHAPDRGPVTAS